MVNRLMGSCFNLLWGGAMFLVIIFLIALIPPNIYGVQVIRQDVVDSEIFGFIKRQFKLQIPDELPLEAFQSPANIEVIRHTDEYKNLMKDPRVQELFSDQELQESIRNKDLGKLIAHPKIIAILQDRKLLSEFFKLNTKIVEYYSEEAEKQKADEEETKDDAYYDFKIE